MRVHSNTQSRHVVSLSCDKTTCIPSPLTLVLSPSLPVFISFNRNLIVRAGKRRKKREKLEKPEGKKEGDQEYK